MQHRTIGNLLTCDKWQSNVRRFVQNRRRSSGLRRVGAWSTRRRHADRAGSDVGSACECLRMTNPNLPEPLARPISELVPLFPSVDWLARRLNKGIIPGTKLGRTWVM